MKVEEFEKDRLDVTAYGRLIWRKKWVVILVGGVVFGVSVWLTSRTEPIYEAVATVQIGIPGQPVGLERLGSLAGSSQMESEIEILRSRVIAEGTAVRLQRHYSVNPLTSGVSVDLSDVVIADRGKAGLYTVTFVDGAGRYEVGGPGGTSIGFGEPGEAFHAGDLSFTISKVSARPGDRVQILIRSLDDVADGLRGILTTVPIRGTNIFSLKVRLNNPKDAARMANAFAETYVEFARQEKIKQLSTARQFLEEQIKAFRHDLLRVGQELAGSDTKRQDEGSLVRRFGGDQMFGAAVNPSDPNFDLPKRLADLEMERAVLEQTYTRDHPMLNQVNRRISEIRNRLVKERQLSREDLPLLELVRDSQIKLSLFTYMLQKQHELRLAEASEKSSARIIDRAVLPRVPVSPNVPQSAKKAAFLGLAVGIGLAIILGYLDRSIRNIKDIEDRLELPVFAAIPEIDCEHRRNCLRLRNRNKDHGDPANFLLGRDGRESRVVEAYRGLRTHIRIAVSEGTSRALLFTSPGPGEGKSLTVANLAIAMSQGGGRVLVVDCDLRKPDQSKLFKLGQQAGISEVLAGKCAWREVTQSTTFENVDVLPCGEIPADPAELLAGNAMKEFLEKAQEHYRLILFDSPPVLLFTDACAVAPLTGGVLVVVRSKVTSSEAISRVQSLLGAVNAKLIGLILNGVPRSEELRYYGYYGYYKYHDEPGKSHSRSKGLVPKVAQRMLRHLRRA